MDNYFEGVIEYISTGNGEDSTNEILFIKDNSWRFEMIYAEKRYISIYTPNKHYSIKLDEKLVVDCSDYENTTQAFTQIKQLKEKAIILNYHCSSYKIDGYVEYESEKEIIDEKHFVNPNFKIHPTLKDEFSLFRTQHIPLKTFRNITIDGTMFLYEAEAVSIKKQKLDSSLFDTSEFLEFEIITWEEEERRLDEKRKAEREKMEREREERKKELEIQNKIMKAKLIKFLSIDLNRELTEEEKGNPYKFVLASEGDIPEKEAYERSVRFLKFL